MKTLKLSFLLLFVFIIASCSKEEEATCTLADWLGTYTGTALCDGKTQNATLTISKVNTNEIKFAAVLEDGTENDYPSLKFGVDCTLSETKNDGTTIGIITGELTDKKSLSFKMSTTGSINSSCKYTVSK